MTHLYEKEIQTLAFLVPSVHFDAHFDIVKKTPLPALMESSIKIISELESIPTVGLQEFFGLNNIEMEVLSSELLRTGWVEYNDSGNMGATDRLKEWIRDDGNFLEITESHPCEEKIVIDLLTKHIQPRSKTHVSHGFFKVINSKITSDYDIKQIFQSQFKRYKDCVNTPEIKHPQSNLYRIKSISKDRMSDLIYVIKFSIYIDQTDNLKIDTNLVSHEEKHQNLVTSSGVYSSILEYISSLPKTNAKLDFNLYCDFAEDEILRRYYNFQDNYFDLIQYMKDRKMRKTGYGSAETSGLIGPIYLDGNHSTLDGKAINLVSKHLRFMSNDINLPFAILKPSNSAYFANSPAFKIYIEEINENLRMRDSKIQILYPNPKDRREAYELTSKIKSLINDFYFISSSQDLDESEIFIIPGENGFAYCQYHVYINPELGFPSLTIPVGYWTKDPDRINKLLEIVKGCYSVKSLKDIVEKPKEISNDERVRLAEQLSIRVAPHNQTDGYRNTTARITLRGVRREL